MPYAYGEQIVPPIASQAITRTRYLELTKIANELCEWMEKEKGVRKHEACIIRNLVETLWYLKEE